MGGQFESARSPTVTYDAPPWGVRVDVDERAKSRKHPPEKFYRSFLGQATIKGSGPCGGRSGTGADHTARVVATSSGPAFTADAPAPSFTEAR